MKKLDMNNFKHDKYLWFLDIQSLFVKSKIIRSSENKIKQQNNQIQLITIFYQVLDNAVSYYWELIDNAVEDGQNFNAHTSTGNITVTIVTE